MAAFLYSPVEIEPIPFPLLKNTESHLELRKIHYVLVDEDKVAAFGCHVSQFLNLRQSLANVHDSYDWLTYESACTTSDNRNILG